jgi:hypothetical protein
MSGVRGDRDGSGGQRMESERREITVDLARYSIQHVGTQASAYGSLGRGELSGLRRLPRAVPTRALRFDSGSRLLRMGGDLRFFLQPGSEEH